MPPTRPSVRAVLVAGGVLLAVLGLAGCRTGAAAEGDHTDVDSDATTDAAIDSVEHEASRALDEMPTISESLGGAGRGDPHGSQPWAPGPLAPTDEPAVRWRAELVVERPGQATEVGMVHELVHAGDEFVLTQHVGDVLFVEERAVGHDLWVNVATFEQTYGEDVWLHVDFGDSRQAEVAETELDLPILGLMGFWGAEPGLVVGNLGPGTPPASMVTAVEQHGAGRAVVEFDRGMHVVITRETLYDAPAVDAPTDRPVVPLPELDDFVRGR